MDEIQLERVSAKDRYILYNLMQFYMYEFSQYTAAVQLDSNGSFIPLAIESYWQKENLHPFFIKKGEKRIGFALVESSAGSSPNVIEEFFIMAQYKRKGYGKKAARKLFTMFPGSWEITQIEKNLPAQAFWKRVISELTNGHVEKKVDQQKKVILQFHTEDMIKAIAYEGET